MKKEYIVGGLAIIGAVALFAYLTPKGTGRNSDGFFGASGRGMMSGGGTMNKQGCAHCKDRAGNMYQSDPNGNCRRGHRCTAFYARNSDGFFGASGGMMSGGVPPNSRGCAVCNSKTTGANYVTGVSRACRKGDVCVKSY